VRYPIFTLVLLAAGTTLSAAPAEFAIGADLSFLRDVESRGIVFHDNGQPKPGLQIFRDHGYNWIRLRIFHTPTKLPNSLDYTIALARDAKALGYKFLLDFHYSDTWADPGHQPVPKAWESMAHPQIVSALRNYTTRTIAAFRRSGVLPDMVQIGNEVDNGIVWPDGKLPENWPQFVDLLKAGIEGVEAGREDAPRPQIMIHIAKGGDRIGTKAFLDKLAEYQVPYDVIGQSYYPWWHGSLQDLKENLEFMAATYDKDIILVEVAYNCRPAEYAKKGRAGPFPETPEGQRQFLEEVTRIALSTPNGRCKGIFWWEPAVHGPLERRGFFDKNKNALPVITVFDKYTRR
jgi:arabinogalactan endo-1,4-beta-galactosidase